MLTSVSSLSATQRLVVLMSAGTGAFDSGAADGLLDAVCGNYWDLLRLYDITRAIRRYRPVTAEAWTWLMERFSRDTMFRTLTDIASDDQLLKLLVSPNDLDQPLAWALRTRRHPSQPVPDLWLPKLVRLSALRSVDMLLRTGLCPDIDSTYKGRTALQYAARLGHWPLVRMLLDLGGEVAVCQIRRGRPARAHKNEKNFSRPSQPTRSSLASRTVARWNSRRRQRHRPTRGA